ncbi:MAG: hypothetical protein DRQ49_11290 [Gammaproteobacteria bacterium]|nr:MAG: hypothetical protein DRQ49_11290 [Gammaproteobacteria bacterium]
MNKQVFYRMETRATNIQSTSIPIPPDFPVKWESPNDANFFWEQERLHFPEQTTAMDLSLLMQPVCAGFNKVAETYDVPVTWYCRHINTYIYKAMVPKKSPLDKAQWTQEQINEVIAAVGVRWKNEWLPEIKTYLADWEAYNLKGATMQALLEQLNETEKRQHRLWEIHFLLVSPSRLAITLFSEMYQELFSDASPSESYELLSGFENRMVESNKILWELSRQASASPTVRKIISENAADEVVAQLAESEEGKTFLAKLNNYLQEYGKRTDKFRFNYPSWSELPTPVIQNLKGYIMSPDERDVIADMKKIGAQREEKINKARERLQNYPGPIRAQFELLLKAAQIGSILGEEHPDWLEFQPLYYTRQLLLELGHRLVDAGAFNQQDDVFYLSIEELRETLATPSSPLNRRTLVNERRVCEKQFSVGTPPPKLGTLPAGPPPAHPLVKAGAKFMGTPPPVSEYPNELKGHTGSGGIAQGTAKIVRVLEETKKLKPGDILVTETTIPSWTPLFATIAGVVTDTGGTLSHAAVIAREYGIPAVVGTVKATRMIQEGQTIEVNGDVGQVRIISNGK